ncbi:M20/M25/M40 family metallo-hydrolase [Archangium lansingense]|uniref:M20/M25/M40 family metallo-hydrolase n=1 Tax=Archangium lansingense TaxID=2995310 RepID=UPI003B82AB10
MAIRKFGPVVALLACAAPAFAEAAPKEKEVWITIGSDALEPARASFKEKGLVALPAPALEKGGVAALRVPESQLEKLAEAMHDKLNRCAGFMAHDSEAQARAAVEGTSAPQALASLVSYTLNNSASVNVMLGGVQELNIRNTINSLSTSWTSRRYNQQGGADAATWLKNQWTTIANGRSDVQVAFFTHTSTVSPQPSVIATITGTTHPNEVVVIGGHLDSINTGGSTLSAPGADDDASGVASLTEAFRVAMANGYKPARTVKFMAYAAEEVGLKGSADIAAWHVTNGVNVVGVLQLDMTNFKGSSYDFAMVTDNTNAAQNSFVTSLISTYQSGLTYTNISCGYGCSDHASWHARGFATSMPFEATMSTSNPYIHSANDTLTNSTNSNASNSVKFSKLAVSFLGELAKGATTGNTPPPVDSGGGGGTINTATYDATLKAPRCTAAGAGCDSGSLLNGRGGLGPEVNKPNTINASCTDGASGTYHSDESNDRLKVATTDGTNLAAGKQVTVTATVWAYSASSDTLDLYYTANASSPSWTLIGSYKPSGSGVQTITANYTLPAGANQAIRANFRYQGSAGTCTTGSYDDRDDLIFSVQ